MLPNFRNSTRFSPSGYSNINQYQGGQQLSMYAQQQEQSQARIIDQNYANDILMIVFSTLETLAAREKSFNVSKKDKIYGHYDSTDYSQKNYKQLLSQLQIHLLNFETSKKLFEKKYGPSAYTLPSSFTKADFFEQIEEFKTIFAKNPEIKEMVYDFSSLMSNTKAVTSYGSKNYDVDYSEKEKKLHRSNLLNTGIKAGNIMREERENVIRGNYQNSSQLPVQVNYGNRGKSSIHGVTRKNN